jgi:hypothetical protein
MLAIVMVAAAAAADPLVCPAFVVGLAVAVAVPLAFSCVEVLDPPHAVANAATRHMAAQNKPNLFMSTPLDWTLARDTIIDPNWFTCGRFRASSADGAYSAAVKGPVAKHTGCGGFPFNEQPLPVEMYVAPGRYGW